MSSGGGTHYTLWMNIDENKVYYFDTYGVVPPKQVEKWLKTSGKPIAYSSAQVQPIGTTTCGYYCVYAAAKTLENSFYDALESFGNDYALNEKMIIKYFV